MRKLKKLLSVLLSAALLASLAACASEDLADAATAEDEQPVAETTAEPEEEEVEERVIEGSSGLTLRLAWYGDGQDKDALDAALQQYVDETGIGVETVFIPGSWAEYFTKIQTMIAGGEQLDCAYVAIEGFAMFIDLGMAKPIDDWIADNGDTYHTVADDVDANVLAFMNFDGQQYGIPCEWNNVVTHFNTALLAEAGLDLPAENWGRDELLAYAGAMTKERDDGTKQYGIAVPDYYFGFEAWLYNNGAAYMNEDFTESRLLEPETIEMFQLAQDLIYEYGYAPVPEDGIDMIQHLVDGNVGMGFWGRWPTTKYVSSDFTDVAVQYVPNFTQNQVIWGGAGVFTLGGTQHPDEATDLSIWLASAPFIKEFMQYGAIPVLNSVASEVVPGLGIPDNCELYFESASKAVTVSAPPQYAEAADLLARVLQDILRNKQDVLETLTAADAELNLILSENA